MRALSLGLLAAAVLAAPAAAVSTYVGGYSLGGLNFVSFVITTDGTVGPLDAANILSWNVNGDAGDGLITGFSADPANVQVEGLALVATPRRLLFDFDGDGVVLFVTDPAFGRTSLCLVGAQFAFNCVGPKPGVTFIDYPALLFAGRSLEGVQRIAVDPFAIPEPASWALFVGGFGLVGRVLRTRIGASA